MRGDYLKIADRIAADIRSGRLQPGDRLAPQREFALQRGIAVSTASRVYGELVKRGLVVGEIGRGSYVRAGPKPVGPALSEPAAAGVDLELNFPVLSGQEEELVPSIALLLRPDVLAAAMCPIGVSAHATAREIAATFLKRHSFEPDPACVLFAGNGKQAIAAALSAIARPGDRIGVEALTYPVVKSIAALLGIRLVSLPIDAEGIVPEAVAAIHREMPLHGLYLQPTLHNPLGITMSAQRRRKIGQLLQSTGLIAIEDAIYSFLAPEQMPLAAVACEHTILVDSLSKRVAPGLTLGFILSPPHLTDKVGLAIRMGSWSATGFPLAASLRWIRDGTVSRLEAAKRGDAKARQSLARRLLKDLELQGDPRAYHLLLEVPESWRSESFAASASREGIAVTPASAFAIGSGHAPNAVRLALASPSTEILTNALKALRRIALWKSPNLQTE